MRIGGVEWTGPLLSDCLENGDLKHPVPPERWPYGPPAWHQACCLLFEGATFCDCRASDAEDLEYGVGS